MPKSGSESCGVENAKPEREDAGGGTSLKHT